MIPTKTVELAGASAIAAAAAMFNPAAGSEQLIVLFKNNELITRNTILADLTLAAFEGYGAIECAAGAPQVAINPVTGAFEVRLREPAGGFEWIAGGEDLPETIYGFAVLNNAGTLLIAAQNFDTPIVLNAANQVIDVPQPKVSLQINYMT